MPELPEVESRRRFAEKHLVGRTIERASTTEDRIVYEGVTPRRFGTSLKGRSIRAVRRKGKQLWMELDERPWPALHFGMGGDFYTYRERSERPRFWKLELLTDTGLRIAMTNPRRLGRIRLQEDPEAEPPISKLGPDPLTEPLSTPEFSRQFLRRQAPVKAVLLDQGVMAGIGNWIADEVLYQAGIDPRRVSGTLNPEEIKRLRRKIGSVIRKAVSVDADSDRFPRGWLFHHRWGKNPDARTAKGEAVCYLTVAGRTTAWVPGAQH